MCNPSLNSKHHNTYCHQHLHHQHQLRRLTNHDPPIHPGYHQMYHHPQTEEHEQKVCECLLPLGEGELGIGAGLAIKSDTYYVSSMLWLLDDLTMLSEHPKWTFKWTPDSTSQPRLKLNKP